MSHGVLCDYDQIRGQLQKPPWQQSLHTVYDGQGLYLCYVGVGALFPCTRIYDICMTIEIQS